MRARAPRPRASMKRWTECRCSRNSASPPAHSGLIRASHSAAPKLSDRGTTGANHQYAIANGILETNAGFELSVGADTKPAAEPGAGSRAQGGLHGAQAWLAIIERR